jgi:hypothetical protein
MNWMDLETEDNQSVDSRLTKLEIKSKMIDYYTKRIEELRSERIQDSSEFDYCELIGRIKEVETALNYIKENI